MVFDCATYQSYLKRILLERSQKNASYSLRAMARQLGLQPSLLSEVLNGNRQLTEESAVMVAEKLGLEGPEQRYFRTLVQLGRTKSTELKEALIQQLAELHPQGSLNYDLSVDHFLYISNWIHFAILRLLDLPDFKFDPTHLADALSTHVFEIEAALERLQRLELIERTDTGKYRKIHDNLLVKSPTHNEALKKYHEQMLRKTLDALAEKTPQERFTGTENVTLAAEQLDEATQLFEKCFQKILELSAKRKPGAEVYHLGIHMIQISERNKTKRKGKTK